MYNKFLFIHNTYKYIHIGSTYKKDDVQKESPLLKLHVGVLQRLLYDNEKYPSHILW